MPDGELLIVAADELSGFAIKRYGLRWEIETLFACLKSGVCQGSCRLKIQKSYII
jgi:heterodisulfide reductase subunit C